MGTNIENEVVKMIFDALQFQKGIQESIKQIEDLKKTFDFAQAQKSMEELERGSKIDFNPLGKALDSINGKLSVMGVAAGVMVQRITNAVIDGAKRIADVLLVQPIVTGLEEYETQLNAIQTILANTTKDGTTLEQVNDALDELNTYADLTIYNFTQMTSSIGKFTAAGVDLDTSVASIKGIANVAALSGSNAQQASTAMYQLSQAISSGVVRLQDWISVENAGMGGEVFRESLIETARVHGVAIDTILEQAGGFRNSLQEKWLTSDILTDTLEKFTGDLTDAQLEQMGYTEEQIVGIQKMAETANDAATKIKTLTQLKDTMAEALQSGWGQTWRIIFGDFEEAKQFWGDVAGVFGGIIDSSAKARNELLGMWKAAGGRTIGIQGFMNIVQAVINILDTMKSAFQEVFTPLNHIDLYDATVAFRDFSVALLKASQNTGPLRTIVKALASGLDILRLVVLAVLRPLWEMVRGLAPVGGTFLDTTLSIADAIIAFREFAVETDFFNQVVAQIISRTKEFVQQAKTLVQAFLSLDVVKNVIGWFQGLQRPVVDLERIWAKFLPILQAVAAPFYFAAVGAKMLYDRLVELQVLDRVAAAFNSINWAAIQQGFRDAATYIRDFMDGLRKHDLLAKFKAFFDTFDGRRFSQFLADAKDGFSWLTNIFSKINGQLGEMGTKSDDVGEGLSVTAEQLGEGIGKLLTSLTENAQNLDYSGLFAAINTGLLAGLVLSLRKIATGGFITDALDDVFGEDSFIGETLIDSLDTFQGTLKSYQNNIRADTLQKIAISIGIFAGAIALLTLIDSTKLAAATVAIAAMIGTVFASSGALGKINTIGAIKASIAISGMAVAMVIVSTALRAMSGFDPSEIELTFAAVAAGLAGLVLAVRGLGSGTDTTVLKTTGVIIALSGGLHILFGAVRKFGSLEADVLAQGLQAIALSMGLMVASLAAIGKFSETGLLAASVAMIDFGAAIHILLVAVRDFGNMDIAVLQQGLQAIGAVMGGFALMSRILNPQGMIGASIGLLVMSGALIVMSQAVKAFGAIAWDELQRGLIGLGAAMLLIVLASNLMSGALAGAVAMLIMSVAIAGLSISLRLLAGLDWAGLAVGIAGLAAVFVVLGLAGLLLAPVAPVLLLLGLGMLAIGAAAALLGVGLLAASTGLVALSAAAGAIAAAITVVGTAIIGLLPAIGGAIATSLANFLQVIADNQPAIVDAMKRIILGMIDAVASLIPDIVAVMLDMITALLDAIAERLPDMIQRGYDILLAFLQGIADNVADIIATGIMIVTEIINGIAEALPDLIDAAFNLILTFLNSMADAIEEYMPKIIDAGMRIGKALVEGTVKGITKHAGLLYDKMLDMAKSAWEKVKGFFGIQSPSKLMYKAGTWIVLGLANAIRDKTRLVEAAMAEMSQKGQNAMDSLLKAIISDIDSAINVRPVITPVLDLSNVTAGVDTINGTFANSSILGALTYEGDLVASGTAAAGADGSGGVTFIQNNYSPQALDRAAIYRQTKTHVAKLRLQE